MRASWNLFVNGWEKEEEDRKGALSLFFFLQLLHLDYIVGSGILSF